MVKKITVLVIMLVMVNTSFGQWLNWTNDGGDQNWVNASNWTAYPTGGDDVVIGTDAATGPILHTYDTGYANWLHVCDNATPAGSKLTIDGGTLNVADHAFIGQWGTDQKGTIEVNSGTMNTTLLMCGGDTSGAQGDGTLLMNGGTVNISWLLAVAGGYNGDDGAGIGHIQLDGGLIDVTGGGGLVMSSSGSVDFTGGTLILNGEITDMSGYGNVTAYAGAGSFVYDYDGGADRTTITAIPEPATLVLIGLGAVLFRRKRA
jgi:PEP-CTERM motif-containing protein